MIINNNYNIVLIADRYSKYGKIEIDNYDLEMANEKYYQDILGGLSTFCKNITIYNSPKSFLKNIDKHKSDIVLSIWSGTKSKSRKGLVPAICEAYGIKYVGSDCYVQIVSQDKALSKELCKKYNIHTPEYRILSSNYPNTNFESLNLPLIVKPLHEGGSIGISSNNLTFSYTEAKAKCEELLKHYDSIMVEEYIDGYELCVILFGNRRGIKVKGASMINVDGKCYLEDFIWGYETKKESNSTTIVNSVNAEHLLTDADWEKFEKLFFSLGKVELIRIDGRVNENGFNFIELSPDPHIGSGASVAKVFEFKHINYNSMLKMLIENAILSDEGQNAKMPAD